MAQFPVGKSRWLAKLAALLIAPVALPAGAQSVISVLPGLLHHVEGKVLLEDALKEGPATGSQRHLLEGQTLRTVDGRAEVLLDLNTFARLAKRSELAMERADLSDLQLRLDSGSVVVEVRKRPVAEKISILAGDTAVSFLKKGLYRIDYVPGESALLRVYKGQATVLVDDTEIEVNPKRSLTLDALAGQFAPASFDRSRKDEFDEWNRERIALIDRDERARRASKDPWSPDLVISAMPGAWNGSLGSGSVGQSPSNRSPSGGSGSSGGAGSAGSGGSSSRGSGASRSGGR